MELEITRLAVPEGAIMPAQTAELPIECDILLPDYCPDILKILRCAAEIKISGAEDAAGRLGVEGVAYVTVCYLSEGMELCRSEQRLPFTKNFDFGGECGRGAVSVTAEVENVNCRAVSPRPIDVRGAFMVTARRLCLSGAQAVTGVSGGGVELLRRGWSCTDILGEQRRTFTVRETGEIGYGKPEAASVARVSGMARVTECRVIQEKIITKGELSVSVLWLPQEEGGEPQRSGFVFPIGQILEQPGADEGCVCDARYRLLSAVATISEDGHNFEVEATVLAFSRLQRETEAELAEDAYSTKYACEAPVRQISALTVLAPVSEAVAVEETLDMPEGVVSVMDCWAEAQGVPEQAEDGSFLCRARVCVLARDGEGSVEYFEKPFSVATPVQFAPEGGQSFADVDAAADEAECALEDAGRARVRFKVFVEGCVYGFKKCRAITDVAVDGERPKDSAALPAVTLYYADAGERVWDIAKRYGSTAAAVAEENSLEGGELAECRMLLIPAVT